jgi:hypothetical protein
LIRLPFGRKGEVQAKSELRLVAFGWGLGTKMFAVTACLAGSHKSRTISSKTATVSRCVHTSERDFPLSCRTKTKPWVKGVEGGSLRAPSALSAMTSGSDQT